MRTVFVLCAAALLLAAVPAVTQTLPHLTVEDVGTPLDIPVYAPIYFGSFAVSPDGQWIAYTIMYPETYSHIYLKPVAGGEAILIHTYDQFAEQFKNDPEYKGVSSNFVRSITFTPDSQEITFRISIFYEELGSKYIPCIWSININTGEVREILIGGEDPLWDPTGRYLLYDNYDYRAFIEGLQPENHNIPMVLDTMTGESWVPNDEMVWYHAITPDGQYILFWGSTGEEYVLSNGKTRPSTQVFRCPLAGGETEQITYMNDGVLSIYSIAVSPDGKWLFFCELTDICLDVNFDLDDDPLTTGSFERQASCLSVLNMVTGDYYKLFPVTENLSIKPLCISPDGKTLYAYVYDISLRKTRIGGERIPYEWVVAMDFDPENLGEPFITAVKDVPPAAFPTLANYPNPFNPSTTISFTLPVGGFTELTVYNMAGQRIRTLVAGELSAGVHEVVWDGRDDAGTPVSSGIFVSRLKTGDAVVTNRMTMVK